MKLQQADIKTKVSGPLTATVWKEKKCKYTFDHALPNTDGKFCDEQRNDVKLVTAHTRL